MPSAGPGGRIPLDPLFLLLLIQLRSCSMPSAGPKGGILPPSGLPPDIVVGRRRRRRPLGVSSSSSSLLLSSPSTALSAKKGRGRSTSFGATPLTQFHSPFFGSFLGKKNWLYAQNRSFAPQNPVLNDVFVRKLPFSKNEQWPRHFVRDFTIKFEIVRDF